LLAVTRAGLAAVRDGYVGAPLALAGAGVARRFLEGLVLALPAALLLAWLGSRAARRPAQTGLPLLLATTFLGYLFATFRLPADPYYAPGLTSTRAVTAHVAALCAALGAAWILAGRPRVPLLRPAAALLAGLALLAAGLRTGRARVLAGDDRAAWPGRPNVILISLDTLRADRVGALGGDPATTPELDRFAARALRFTHAFTPEPWTLSAHMSLLTGLHPTVHGVDGSRPLPPSVTTLAQVFRAGGYATLAVVDTCPWLEPRYGFDRGFDLYRRVRDDADLKIDRALTYVDDVGSRPFFLFLHLFDAHSDRQRLPYESARADREHFAGWYRGPFEGCEEGLGCASMYLREVNRRGLALDAERLRYLASLYDAGVHTLDRKLGRLFRALEGRGLFASSVIAVVADHGEEFQEHGRVLHEQDHAECTAVPLLLYAPGGAAGACDELASLVDVAPTLYELAGLPPPPRAPKEGRAARSLAPLVRGESGAPPPDYLLLDGGPGLAGLRGRRYLLLRHGDGFEAFDLKADPGERAPLEPAAWTPRVHALVGLFAREDSELARLRRSYAESPGAVELPDAELARLRSLGYADE
jgi:Sulfatase